jgi:hypothetical protein
MEIQRRCHHPNQPPLLYKCGGKNCTQQPNFTRNAKNQTSPHFPSLLTPGEQSPHHFVWRNKTISFRNKEMHTTVYE